MTLSQINNQIRIGWRLFFVVLLIALGCSCVRLPQEEDVIESVKYIGDSLYNVETNSYSIITNKNYKVGDTLYINNSK